MPRKRKYPVVEQERVAARCTFCEWRWRGWRLTFVNGRPDPQDRLSWERQGAAFREMAQEHAQEHAGSVVVRLKCEDVRHLVGISDVPLVGSDLRRNERCKHWLYVVAESEDEDVRSLCTAEMNEHWDFCAFQNAKVRWLDMPHRWRVSKGRPLLWD